ncbi:hypothetical protein GD627_09475 [Arthrobacter yangruifuii]|uniref:RHS repeat protein n=1 Tax=Arthrobacter yangruifuii TaxID=2606616 RepID=A0A5N6MI21_9MICC|nr:hypothetical protein GD627_09475 [Arthrobacter yangruifuii]
MPRRPSGRRSRRGSTTLAAGWSSPPTGPRTYAYDAAGQLLSVPEADGSRTEYPERVLCPGRARCPAVCRAGSV